MNALIYKYLKLLALYSIFIILFVELILPTFLGYLLNPKFYVLAEHTELIIFLAVTSIFTKLISNYFIFKKQFKTVFLAILLKVIIFTALIYNNYINLNNILTAFFVSDLFYILTILLVFLYLYRLSKKINWQLHTLKSNIPFSGFITLTNLIPPKVCLCMSFMTSLKNLIQPINLI